MSGHVGADVSPRLDERQLALPRAPGSRGISLYAVLFGGVLLLLLVTLVLEDLALRASLAAQAERDAAMAAVSTEGAVALRITALRGLRGLVLDGTPGDSQRFRRMVPAIATLPTPLFERLMIATPDGRVIHDTLLGAPLDAAGDRELHALLRLQQGPRLDAATRAQVTVLRTLPGMAAITLPLAVDSQVVAMALGVTRGSAFVTRATRDASPRRRALVVRSGADTLVQSTAAAGRIRPASATAHTRGGGDWQVEVVHEDTAPGVRATLWVLGGSALVFLVLGLARERRQARSVAERSAELERLSSELLRSNRMKSEFLANISHELRTPLNAIVGFVELLRDGVYGELSPRQTNPVERIAGSATHLRHLVDQVLDIAKMAAGRLEVHLEPVVLRPFVLNVASELESLAADKGIVLSLTVSAALPRVRTDPSHLRQILVNLVGNAIKYTPSGGAVAIRTRLVGIPPQADWRVATPDPASPGARPPTNPAGTRAVEDESILAALRARSPDPARTWVAVQVSDTGIGIAPEDHERIFEEFEQVNAGPRGESMERGTGLGLPISRRLARLLGGEVTVESESGRGATFTLWLPVEMGAPVAPAPAVVSA